ncbi:uncharacterized protein LOC142345065 isoform X1 [Convolutriloba macropyga]|uniref:uncharacterized protein LOC142345065 isoform X1 n=1 Tax=Convolutriloba macropyga TaxID=536237 RepID=UPI003F52045B
MYKMIIDRRRCILTLVVLTISTVFVVYRFGPSVARRLSKIDLFKGHEKKGDLVFGENQANECVDSESSSCSKCNSKEMNEIIECSMTGFIRTHLCKRSNGTIDKKQESCALSSDETREFLIFQGVSLLIGIVSTLYVIRRKKELQDDLQTKVNKMISSN